MTLTTSDANATSARVRDEMREAGLFEPLTPEGEHHRAIVKGILAHYDEHEAAGTPAPDACCDALGADEEAAWSDVLKAEGWQA